jgi:hypothetical protein
VSTRLAAPRLGRLIAGGDVAAVRAAVEAAPQLLTRGVERTGAGGWTPRWTPPARASSTTSTTWVATWTTEPD